MKTLRSNQGFSLVELMVVVAIIGILATMAIPQVNRFVAQSRQSEARVTLSAIYQFNTAFRNGDAQSYTSSLDLMGFRPGGTYRYNTGFNARFPDAVTATIPVLGANERISLKAGCGVAAPGWAADCTLVNQTAGTDAPVAAVATQNTFLAHALGNISQSGASVDTWTLSENKIMTNTVNGLD